MSANSDNHAPPVSGVNRISMVGRVGLERVAASIGKMLAEIIDDTTGTKGEVGFALFVFDYGPGHVGYMSSANREDIVRLVREWCDRQEVGSDPAGPRGAS
jgi:hypothetical protein